MYKCKACGKEFPVVAWIKTNWVMTVPETTFSAGGSNLPTTASELRKPCCPYCHQIEIEEIKEKDELTERFMKELMDAVFADAKKKAMEKKVSKGEN